MILLIIMSLLEIAAGVFIFIWRTNIYQSLYGYISAVFQMQASDLYTLRNRFNCCGNGIPNSVCTPTDRPCTTEISSRLDGMFLVAGIVLIGILALQLIAIILAGAVVCCGKSNKVQ
uniref:Tetraspanin n=1 Tax=Acrobeloides nanus TaxID=290746 RepID=A0A914CV10_9BILA